MAVARERVWGRSRRARGAGQGQKWERAGAITDAKYSSIIAAAARSRSVVVWAYTSSVSAGSLLDRDRPLLDIEPSDPQRRTLAERGPSIAAEDHRLVARTRLIGETGDLAGLQCVRERGRTRWHPDASTS